MLHNETIRPTPRHRLRLPLRQLPAMDLPFLVLVLTLVGFGLVMLASASSAVALYRRGDAWAYLRPQLLYAALGLVGLWLASRVDYHIFHKLAWPLLALSLVLLVAVLFMPEYNGCKRWLVLPGLGTLQPSEIAKFAVVLVFSHVISLNHDQMKRFSVGVLPFALVLGVVAALMLLEPHLSGTLLILGIGAVLMFVGGTGLKWFVLAGVSGVAAIGAAVVIMPDLVPTPPTGSTPGWTPLPTRWATATRPSRACMPSAPAGLPGWGWATAARNICSCQSPRTILFFPSFARSWALWGPVPWWGCSCCCSGGESRWRPMRPIVSGHCWWSASRCRWPCRPC